MATYDKSKLVEGKYTVTHLMKTAQDVVKAKTTGTAILDADAEANFPKFQESEITLGRVLGRGGFCAVSEITNIKLRTKEESNVRNKMLDDEHAIHNVVQDRAFMEKYCLRGTKKDCRYALKRLQASVSENGQTFVNGVVDLAIEVRFLAVIRHPNIIKMRAMAVTSPFSAEDSFFVVLDRLYDILSTRIAKWKKQKPKGVGKMLDLKGKKEGLLWVERIAVAYDLSSALQYLHESNIIYRDIKPDNIGFDIRGDVKIFDFGLAKEIKPSKKDRQGMYNLTGDTGSPRYMAPEVALGKPYNERCDVYSFSILIWQMLSLETPFAGYTMNMFNKRVVEGGVRPKIDPKWPSTIIGKALEQGWGDQFKRQSMSELNESLRGELQAHSEDYEESQGILDASQKSELALRGDKSFVNRGIKKGGSQKGKEALQGGSFKGNEAPDLQGGSWKGNEALEC